MIIDKEAREARARYALLYRARFKNYVNDMLARHRRRTTLMTDSQASDQCFDRIAVEIMAEEEFRVSNTVRGDIAFLLYATTAADSYSNVDRARIERIRSRHNITRKDPINADSDQ